MNQVLAYLMTEHSVSEIVQALANLCLEQAKRAEKPGHSAMWKCNHVELSMAACGLRYAKRR
jgi:hypothetical protein